VSEFCVVIICWNINSCVNSVNVQYFECDCLVIVLLAQLVACSVCLVHKIFNYQTVSDLTFLLKGIEKHNITRVLSGSEDP